MSVPSWTKKLAAPALAALMVLCCLAAPLVVGAAATLTAAAVFGIAGGAIALLVLCLYVGKRVTSDKAC